MRPLPVLAEPRPIERARPVSAACGRGRGHGRLPARRGLLSAREGAAPPAGATDAAPGRRPRRAAGAPTWPPRARSSSTSTCSRTDSRRASKCDVAPAGAYRLPRRGPRRRAVERAGRAGAGASTPRAAPRSCAPGSAGGRGALPRGGAQPRGGAGRRRAHALRARHRPRPGRVPPPLQPRPADRAGDPAPALAAAAPAAGAVRGARLGGLRAADRGRARRGDRAPDRASARVASACGRCAARRRPSGVARLRAGGAGRLRPGAQALDSADPRRPRGRLRPRRPAPPRAVLAAPAGDPEHRQLDDRDARLRGPGARRHAARRSTSPT